MRFLHFILILFLLDKVCPTFLRDFPNPRSTALVNLNEENILKRGFSTNKHNNEDSQATAEELMYPSGREELTKSPPVYGQYPYQQLPQHKEVVKKNNPYEQILPNQQIEEHISHNAYRRPVQELPEEQMRQNYFQQFPQNAPVYLQSTHQYPQQWPQQYNSQQTGVHYNVPEQAISPFSQPTTLELSNNENQNSNKQIAEIYKQQIEKYLQNAYKKSEQDVSQSTFQYGPNLEGRYSGEHFPQNRAGVLYPPNFYQRHLPQHNEEQVGYQRHHMFNSYPPSYEPNNIQPFYGPSATEIPVEDQPERTRHIQTGEITVIKVPSGSS